MNTMIMKHFETPDEIRTLPKTKIELVHLGETTLMRATFQPGWKWSECVKPTAGTNSCQVPHINYIVSGHIKIHMDDGSEEELGPGDAAEIPPGHEAWVVGNEPCVALDFSGGDSYGKKLE
ncbi:cupin domain-containing protein [Legionella brunensis]|uniref:Cupin domain protein n=1 Tax=Legionella brunensis TaxID=29422 RepID=A0A0W0S1C4_9GAMM|nr:cupin domain-containing protein [Legionella brunensis]KTC77102.1 Cupin domain protein [Legionella brunensis]